MGTVLYQLPFRCHLRNILHCTVITTIQMVRVGDIDNHIQTLDILGILLYPRTIHARRNIHGKGLSVPHLVFQVLVMWLS